MAIADAVNWPRIGLEPDFADDFAPKAPDSRPKFTPSLYWREFAGRSQESFLSIEHGARNSISSAYFVVRTR